ncbi:DUF5682 family protein [Haloferula sp.]|uniref:DUF5682 family protein n=1 Tax=Haloferula sp. TaxID=2497595 RepID=UPI003C7938E1
MTTLFGIRHHGPGCARSLVRALERLQPEVVVIEMPMEAEDLLGHAGDEAFKPPVAILIHRTDEPEKAGFYPFAEFSPEWQAVKWAVKNGVPVRCFDLPSAHSFALKDEDEVTEPRPDPMDALAKADGYLDGERWWNDRVEERQDDQDFFEAIREAMVALRGDMELTESRETLLREAWMRKVLRKTEKEFEKVAVVCGAWHTPALEAQVKVADDNALLKGLAKHKVAATWIPWTYERLASSSGYRAGIRSPGWYAHVWRNEAEPTTSWLVRAARILRKEGQEASSASVIEAIRLATSLAGMRGRPLPGLDETLESIQAIFCAGDPLALDFLKKPLLVGDALGELPESLPALPLQKEIDATIKRLRMKKAASVTLVVLDLREVGGRNRSLLLHRLQALGVEWGSKERARGKGTFKEEWRLQWKPELAVSIIEASAFGNTIETAAASRLVRSLGAGAGLAKVTEHLDLALLGALPEAVEVLLRRLDAAAASSQDTLELLGAIPPLARIARYGDVRSTDVAAVGRLLLGFTERIHAELLLACSGIDDQAAAGMSESMSAYHAALTMLDEEALMSGFHDCLVRVARAEGVHGVLRGQAVRFLRDGGRIDDEETSRFLGFALSRGMEVLAAAAWLEGFLRGGGAMLVHDRALLALVDEWLAGLNAESFQTALPLVRRTFGTFSGPERSRIASGVAGDLRAPLATTVSEDLNLENATPAVAAVARLLGLPEPS